VQAQELFYHKEQEEAKRTRGVQEVLPLLRKAHSSQGNKVTMVIVRV
jgi:hypothetical protein